MPVPHHVLFLLAVELMMVNASPVSFVCQFVALGFCGFHGVLSGMLCVASLFIVAVV